MLELVKPNRALLRHLISQFRLGSQAYVHDLAASNATYLEPQPVDPAGTETASLKPGKKSRDKRLKRSLGQVVQVDTLDNFLARLALKDVYAVEIDTEGHDALVLEGMHESLRARRVGFLKFEYSHKGYWAENAQDRRTLERTLGWLDEAGYTCFMEARGGQKYGGALAPISGHCWNATLERPHWSNVVCAHDRQGGLSILHNLSFRQYQRRRIARWPAPRGG
jgi:FkbM family methyltransferase